jgi:hypothetical protein
MTTMPLVNTATRPNQLAPAIGLFFLAPLTAEYLIGYLDSTGSLPRLLFGLLFFGPLYGGAALTIREISRRSGRGWLTIILLSFAFGEFQAGLVDHSLFNMSYLDFAWVYDTAMPTYIPALGISVNLTLNYILGHVMWSICVPILFVEAFVPHQRTTPWLSSAGLVVTILLYLGMCGIIFWGHIEEENFLPSPAQLVAATAVVILLIFAAFKVKEPRPESSSNSLPSPWQAGIITFFILSAMTLLEIGVALLGLDTAFLSAWPGTLLSAGMHILLAVLLWRWSRHEAWHTDHMLAVAGGILLTRAWMAFLIEPAGDVATPYKLLHNVVFLLGIVLLIFMALRQQKQAADEE